MQVMRPPVTEISEVVQYHQLSNSKKVSSIKRGFGGQGGQPGENYRISVEGMKWEAFKGQVESPDSGNLHNRGMKGCIPRSAQKNSLKARLLEARMGKPEGSAAAMFLTRSFRCEHRQRFLTCITEE
ncbi:hypothetical protein SESBI_23946 [Sesbania bispinosa]|nr:hypothetical protein SESBI_23946 [Sesbania bispinosa]